MRRFWKILGIFFFLVLSFAISPKSSSAVCVPCFAHNRYECQGGCGGTVKDIYKDTCCTQNEFTFKTTRCKSWQKCDSSSGTCKCDGNCIKTPASPFYYNDPNLPKNKKSGDTDKDVGSSNVLLPVKLDWLDVEGWKDGWSGGSCSSECVQSYVLRIENINKEPSTKKKDDIDVPRDGTDNMIGSVDPKNEFKKILDKSEFNPLDTSVGGYSCFFRSGATHTWHVKGCCSQESKCGQESTFTFTASKAPELLSPYDEDWLSPYAAKNFNKNDESCSMQQSETTEKLTKDIPLTVELKWCQLWYKDEGESITPIIVPPLAYKISVCTSTKNSGNQSCPAQLRISMTECHPKFFVVQPEQLNLLYPEPKFPNERFNLFTKLENEGVYAWSVAACKDKGGYDCTDYSQKWRFQIKGTLDAPSGAYPPDDPTGANPVSIPLTFSWVGSFGAKSYVFQMGAIRQVTETNSVSLSFPILQLNSKYSWTVQSCFGENGTDCGTQSQSFSFTTTGKSPQIKNPQGMNVPLPVTFEWDKVGGAKAYILSIIGPGLLFTTTTPNNTLTLGYPQLGQDKTYTMTVRTCADPDAILCGLPSTPQVFKTAKLGIPSNPVPPNNSKVFTFEANRTFSWSPVDGANYYKYVMTYILKSPEESEASCVIGTNTEKIVMSPSDFVSLSCLGEYTWKIQACLDKDCIESGDFSPEFHFSFVQGEPSLLGLIPCNQYYDNPETSWNERDRCSVKHIFIMIKIIVDFIFWKIFPVLLVLLVIITAVMYFLSMGNIATVDQVKAMWRAAGIGYLIAFFAWTFVNVLLLLAGFKFESFGAWFSFTF